MDSDYRRLNAMLADKKRLEDEVRTLFGQVADLKKRIQEIDSQFHQELVKVKPTEVCPSPKEAAQLRGEKVPDQKKMIALLDKIAKEKPHLVDKLAEALGMEWV